MPSSPPTDLLRELVGHLRALAGTDLSRLQQARLDLAAAAAEALAGRLGVDVDGPPAPAAAPAPAPAPARARALRALVVDDNSINRHVALRMLRVRGVHAEAVESGAAALDALAAMPYHLVLLDVMLPGVDGFDVAREIRARHGNRVVVVGVTAISDADIEGRAAGMDAVFVKPLRDEDLEAAVALCT